MIGVPLQLWGRDILKSKLLSFQQACTRSTYLYLAFIRTIHIRNIGSVLGSAHDHLQTLLEAVTAIQVAVGSIPIHVIRLLLPSSKSTVIECSG